MRRMTVVSPRRVHPLLVLTALLLAGVSAATAQTRVTSPREQFGHDIGADYVLPNYTAFMAYWHKLDGESDRMLVEEIGKSAEGRPQLMAIVTAPSNHRNLARYKEIAQRLANAEGVTEQQARQLAAEGKSVVWIDGGLHATEVLGAQQLLETVYQLVSRTDAETMRILEDVIILATHANPDGMELVSNWYMRNPEPQRRSTGNIPVLYQKYIGHDNNRDFYMMNQPESQNINRILFQEWYPQILYNHHQTGPSGTVMFAPPFRDPFNYNYDPMIPAGIDLVGAAMHNRFLVEGKPGVTTRRGANYSTWWNGGLRTTVYFHNMIGLLTETIGNPTPIEIPFLPNRQLPSTDLFSPIAPQKWPFRNSIDYSVTANYAVLDLASRHREQFLYNIWRMGMNSVERGSRDHWTPAPKRIDAIRVATVGEGGGRGGRGGGGGQDPVMVSGGGIGADNNSASARGWALFRDPKFRDPRGFIIPADQPDFPTATKFVNTLLRAGVTVHRATRDFQVNEKTYPANSYVVKTAQAFRPHVMDMFEPQDHPNDFRFPGGPPIPPYDNAGYTVAFQMGVKFDRIQDGFDGPFEKISGLAKTPPGRVSTSRARGFYLSHGANDAFIAINRLLKAGDEVYWVKQPQTVGQATFAAGTFYIPSKSGTAARVQRYAAELGLNFSNTGSKPKGEALKLRPVRIALWDRYGGSMPSGHTRWLLEQFEFPYELAFPPALNAGNLKQKFDVLVFVDGAIPELGGRGGGGGGGRGGGGGDQNIPEEFRHMQGNVTADTTVPQLRAFLEEGGSIITIGGSTSLARHLGLPMASALVEMRDGREVELPGEKFYIPGSVLQVRVDNTLPLAHGLDERVDVFYDNSPAFHFGPTAESSGLRRVAWFETKEPLRSGWAWGQERLENAVAIAEADVGKGKLFLFGPEILFRGQPHGTFRFFFNGIYYGTALPVKSVP